MHFCWQHRLGLAGVLHTVDGKRVEIINPGTYNTNAGPDFFNAAVKIDSVYWVGNVEMHVKASDWLRHGHGSDVAYDSVILHVVQEDDRRISRTNGTEIPQLVMKCSAEAAKRCNALLDRAMTSLPCERMIKALPSVYRLDWLTSLGVGRLQRKSERITDLLRQCEGRWAQAVFITLARGLGFGLNAEPFEVMARSIPINIIYKHQDDQIQMEALLLGQAGLIPEKAEGEDLYVTALRREYDFLKNKFGLQPPPCGWRMARTRPQNFPHRRVALLAQLMHRGIFLESRIDSLESLDAIRDSFDVEMMGFWATQYTFTSRASTTIGLGEGAIDGIIINVVVPLIYARAQRLGDYKRMDMCLDWMQQIKPEANSIVRLFRSAEIECDSALMSQAVIELRREYCEKKRCIFCRFGHRLLSYEITRP